MVIVILREPSWTFMDPQMDPKIDPARLILEDPCQLKALQGPSKVQIDHFFIDLKTMDKLKNTAWFEINQTLGCGEIGLIQLNATQVEVRHIIFSHF